MPTCDLKVQAAAACVSQEKSALHSATSSSAWHICRLNVSRLLKLLDAAMLGGNHGVRGVAVDAKLSEPAIVTVIFML